MNYRLFKFIFFLTACSFLTTCHLDPVNPNDYRDENEVKDNEFVLSANTIALDEQDCDEVIAVFKDRIVVEKNAKILKSLKPGKILFKNNLVGPDSIVLYRKVIEIRERPNNFLIITQNASLNETFYKYNIDTRSDKYSVRPRSFFDDYLVFDTPYGSISRQYSFQPDISVNYAMDDFVFTSSFDSSNVVNGSVASPEFDMLLKNFSLSVSGKFLAEAAGSFSLDTSLIEPKLLLRIPQSGLALYMEVSLEVSGNLTGIIESPLESFTFGGYDLRLKFDNSSSVPTYSLGPSGITPKAASKEEWIIYTDGNVEIKLNASFYIAFFGATDYAKIGINVGAYMDPGIHHSGDLLNPRPGYNLNFEAGVVMNVFAELMFYFGTNFDFSGPDIKYPLLSGYTVFPQCEPFDNAVFNYDPVSQDFLLRMDNSDPARNFYKVSINGTKIKYLGNEVFDYNKDYIVQIPSSTRPVNEIVISDFFKAGCYIKDNFVNPAGFGTCDEIVFDAEGNDYCTFLVDQTLWMAENLRISTAGYPVRNEGSPEERLYGRLYTYDEITNENLCPDGWHLPSKEEWENLIFYLGGSDIAGLKMKYPSNAVWNGTVPLRGEFNAVPSGEYYAWQNLYGFTNRKAFYWSSEVGPLGEVYFYSISENLNDILEDFGAGKYDHSIKEIAYSCRCVKDIE